ncbi:MAG: hypothetical protein J0I43_10185 [Microbacterium sp.]|uniref:hypothetical protein n=1 Tax=Microbacterium sp. TaxID=51671 RepID=UPI001AC7421C|nr:hypothetical protein [Microbacterium sp.]MBN9177721.1 hypothetical protein [Microbacterium sp.]
MRYGAAVATTPWGLAHDETRQRMRAHAVAALARGECFAFSDITAAAFHDIPLVGVDASRVHTTPFSDNPSKTHRDVVRHKIPLRARDVTVRDGLWVTSLDRTLFDLVRRLRFEPALAALCAGLHQCRAGSAGRAEVDRAAEAQLRAQVAERVDAAAGSRGIHNARLVLELADGRVESPGESRSLARMWEARLPIPDLQVPVETAEGIYVPDFSWPELRMFGEFDGEVKRFDPAMASGRTPFQVSEDQAHRRRAVERATGWRGMHWGWDESADAEVFWGVLVAQGWKPRWRV